MKVSDKLMIDEEREREREREREWREREIYNMEIQKDRKTRRTETAKK